MKKIFSPKVIIIVVLLIIALFFSFITRTKSFDSIVKYNVHKLTNYVVVLTTWKQGPETFNYSINGEEASRIISFLEKHDYKLDFLKNSFNYDNDSSHYSIALTIANEGQETNKITINPDGTILYDNNTYKMQFKDSIEAKKSQNELEELQQWLLEYK